MCIVQCAIVHALNNVFEQQFFGTVQTEWTQGKKGVNSAEG